ncbi:MAG: hypothetical protein ACYDH9_09480 [Limisphaerales bacterium]
MSACLSFNEIVEVGQPQIAEMDRLGNLYPSADAPGACAAFTRQVRLGEGIVVQTYGVAAALARKAGELSEVAGIWKRMSQFCQSSLEVLARLKHKYPDCGTPELYDLVLDYKLAADKRFKGVMEEQACQKTDLPKGLFPELS